MAKRHKPEEIITNLRQINARFRNELLTGEIFYSLREAAIIIESR